MRNGEKQADIRRSNLSANLGRSLDEEDGLEGDKRDGERAGCDGDGSHLTGGVHRANRLVCPARWSGVGQKGQREREGAEEMIKRDEQKR